MDCREREKKTMDIHPQMYTRFLSTQTGTETKRQAGGWTSLFTAYHKHTHTTQWASEALQVCRVDLWDAVIFTHSFIFRQKWKKPQTGSTSRADSQHIEKWEHHSKTRTTICLREFFCCFLIVFIKKLRGRNSLVTTQKLIVVSENFKDQSKGGSGGWDKSQNSSWTLCKFVTMQGVP